MYRRGQQDKRSVGWVHWEKSIILRENIGLGRDSRGEDAFVEETKIGNLSSQLRDGTENEPWLTKMKIVFKKVMVGNFLRESIGFDTSVSVYSRC